jgi:4-hydroxybenzoate polyprenyltransferase
MTATHAATPWWKVALRLGRVSNLPTVWTNVAAGVWLAGYAGGYPQTPGHAPGPAVLGLLALAMSFFYVGGMFLNDAFDREIDARERPERPIPAGLVRAGLVLAAGFGLLLAGEIVVAICGAITGACGGPLLAGAALAAAILVYDRWHKQNPLGPVLMGLCRALVYATAALAVGAGWGSSAVVAGALVAWAYLVGLTYAAKQERLDRLGRLWPLGLLAVPLLHGLRGPPGVLHVAAQAALLAVIAYAVNLLRGRAPDRFPRAVAALIAGISLLDAGLVASAGGSSTAILLTAAGFPATLWMQRWVRGT